MQIENTAKNLLLDKTCDSCAYRHFICSNLSEYKTCDDWTNLTQLFNAIKGLVK